HMQYAKPAMRLHFIFALLHVAIAACSQQSADEASTCIATLQFTGEQWLANSVPTSFVRATIDSADKALEKNKDPRAPEARETAQQMREAVGKNDRIAVANLVKRFAAMPRTP
ncbi:MAG TPA: hypothetical protein VJ853_06950, partial [Thermoanaerobaculia bacterium]|nr:hypothetical protein [Thermoanaerobaculia bacterium]